MLKGPDDLLRSADRERWNEQDALRGHHVIDGLCERRQRLLFRFVCAAAVGGLDQAVVGRGDDGRVPQDRGNGSAEVTREDQRPGRNVLLRRDAQLHDCGAEDVARVVEDGGDAGGDFERLLIVRGAEMRQRDLGLGQVVDRLAEVEGRAGRAGGDCGDVVRVADGLVAHPRAEALLVLEGQLVYAGADDVAVRRQVGGVRYNWGALARGGGSGTGAGGVL